MREMNDSRYYQPLLPASSASRASIDHASAQLLLRTHPPSQPALSILSPPPPPAPPPPLPSAASPTTQARGERERERVRACESDSRRHQSSLSPDTAIPPRLSTRLRLLARASHCSRRSRPRLVALLPSRRRSTYSLLRLSLPTSQLTASDLRVGPHPPTRNRTQQQPASGPATCCHHTTARLSQAGQLATPTSRSTFLFTPTSWTVYLAHHRHSALSVVLLTGLA